MDAVDLIAGALISFIVARFVVRSEIGVRTEQTAVRELEDWANRAAVLADDQIRAWADHLKTRTSDDQVKEWAEIERELRVEYGTLHGRLPDSMDGAATAALDLTLLNQAATSRYRDDILKPAYRSPFPSSLSGSGDWQEVLDWVAERHRTITGDTRRYLRHGSSLIFWRRNR